MRSYVITIPPLWGRGEGGGASKGIYDLDAMWNKLLSIPYGLGLIHITEDHVLTVKSWSGHNRNSFTIFNLLIFSFKGQYACTVLYCKSLYCSTLIHNVHINY